MKRYRLIVFLFLFILTSFSVFSQVSFTSKVSANIIGKSELLEINYELQNAEFENFIQPGFDGWRVVGGPNMSSSTFISNGVRTASMSYQFILQPLSTGSFTIPGAKAVVNGKTITSNPVKVVVDNKTHNTNNQPNNQGLSPLFDPPVFSPPVEDLNQGYDGYLLKEGENIEEKTKKNLFILINVSKKSCYEGEAITAEYLLYSRVNLDAHITRRPSFSGFSSIDLPDEDNAEFEIKEFKGKKFRVYHVRKVQLYPLQAGKQTLEPVEIEAKIQYKKIPSSGNLLNYDPYSPDNIINFPYIVKSDPLAIDVSPFPAENKPTGFTSVTGQFTIKAAVKENQLAKNQAGTLQVEIEGAGNWAMLQNALIHWPKNVEAFEPTVSEYLDSQHVPVSGKKVFDYPFASSDSGIISIAPIQLSYFDPTKKEYVTASTQPIQVTVLNTTLPSARDALALDDKIDFTNVFTEMVVIAFPIIALMLLLWVIVKYRHKRRMEKSPKRWTAPVLNNQPSVTNQQFSTNNDRFMPRASNEKETVTVVTEPATDLIHSFPGMDEPVSDTIQITGETGSTNPREYFESIKSQVQKLLRTKWSIDDSSLEATRLELEQKGMMAEDAESIVMLLQACEKHIYSPFQENINSKEWDEIFAEIIFILDKKRNGH